MSAIGIVFISAGVVAAGLMIWGLLDSDGAQEMFERWSRERREKPEKQPKGPEVGTIRIVEKMDEDGEAYYTALQYRWGNYEVFWAPLREKVGIDSMAIKRPTAEEAQEAANAELDRREAETEAYEESERRRNYVKVMGEFKP